jgi:1-acyl-sn-glycerol-3-phosphate acyltransferase
MAVLSSIIGVGIIFLLSPLYKDKKNLFRTVARRWSRFLIFCSGIKVKVSGLENILKNKSMIFASNHQGAMDILLVLAFIPVNFIFAAKKELFSIPIFGWYLKNAGYLSIDREAILSINKLIEKINREIETGHSLLIFPEGTRSRDGKLGEFKRGSLLSALKAKAPILPVAISGSFSLLSKGTWVIHPHPIRFSIGKPIYIRSEEEYNSKIGEVHNAIADML